MRVRKHGRPGNPGPAPEARRRSPAARRSARHTAATRTRRSGRLRFPVRFQAIVAGRPSSMAILLAGFMMSRACRVQNCRSRRSIHHRSGTANACQAGRLLLYNIPNRTSIPDQCMVSLLGRATSAAGGSRKTPPYATKRVWPELQGFAGIKRDFCLSACNRRKDHAPPGSGRLA